MPPRFYIPRECSVIRIQRDIEVARGEFRKRRLNDPLKEFKALYPTSKAAADAVVDALSEVIGEPSGKATVSRLVGSKATFSTLRSLAAVPISKDDLETLLRNKVNKTSLSRSQALSDSLGALLRDCLDPERFPWVADARPASSQELEMAKLATAVLTTVSAVQAGRRGDERKALEELVHNTLVAKGFVKVAKPSGGIMLPSHFPRPGEFMTTCRLGQHNADFVICLHDGRILALECKASNSEVNGYKRLNKEVVVDARDWVRRFGENVILPAAALRGVFKADNVAEAQSQGVHIFWWHRIRALEALLDKTRP